jgi:hypothetical protein
MKKNILYILAFSIFCLANPFSANAYFTTAQSAELLDDGKGILYTVTYDFGTEKYDLYLPILPVRADRLNELSYEFVDEIENETYKGGNSLGVVTSNAQIKNGTYFIPKGEARRLTLMVLLVLPSAPIEPALDLALQVTGLPFKMVSTAKEVDAHLNPSELQYYRTPAVSFQ